MRVEFENVSFAYRKGEPVLRNISFSIAASKTLSIVGCSGCGKSSLLRILCGLLPNSPEHVLAGKVLIDSLDITTELSAWQAQRSKGVLGFMFQEPCLLPYLSLEDNIHLPLKILDQSADGENLVADYLKLTGLEEARDKLPKQLSGGMKARTALARTFISRPKLLLLDEPFSALDIVWKARLYDELLKLRNTLQSTVVLVTHDIFEAMYFSDTVLVLGDNHSIIETVAILNWRDTLTFNDVINTYHNDFVRIKQMLEYNRKGTEA